MPTPVPVGAGTARRRRAVLMTSLMAVVASSIGVFATTGSSAAAATGRIEITQKSDTGAVLTGGCYSFYDSPTVGAETFYGYECDGYDTAGDDGVVILQDVSGRFRVVEERSPRGYRVDPTEFFVTVGDGSVERVDRTHQPVAALHVVTVNAAQQPVLGSCWIVHYPGEYEGRAAEGCDGDDGAEDGTWTVTDLPPGSYELRHAGTPGYDTITELQPFAIDPVDVTLTIQVGALRPPANTAPPTVTGGVAIGATLTGHDGTWTGSEPLYFTRRWESCDAQGQGCTPIAGATSATYVPTSSQVGRTFRYVVSVRNEAATVEAASATTAALTPPPRTAPQLVRDPLIVRVVLFLVGDPGQWTSNAGPVSYAFQWMRCDLGGNVCVPIDGATNPVLPPDNRYSNVSVRLRVTATNSAGSTDALSAPYALGPDSLAAPMISGNARVGDVLTASTGIWSMTTAINRYSYTWLRCDANGTNCYALYGYAIASNTYRLTGEDVGHTIRVTVNARDSYAGRDSARSSATALVELHPPISVTPPTLSGNPRVGSPLIATTGSWASDRPITEYAYLWLRCDANGNSCYALYGYYIGAKTYSPTAEDLGKTIRVRVFARNADGTEESADSAATAVIAKHPPVSTAPPTLSGTPQVGKVLTASTGTWASDLPLGEYSYTWLRCDANGNNCYALYGYAIAANTYRLTAEDVGHQIRVSVWARNAEGGADSPKSPATPVIIA